MPLFSSSSQAKAKEKNDRLSDIRLACRDRDLNALRQFAAAEGGFVDDELRREACTRQSPPNAAVGS